MEDYCARLSSEAVCSSSLSSAESLMDLRRAPREAPLASAAAAAATAAAAPGASEDDGELDATLPNDGVFLKIEVFRRGQSE